MIQLQYFKNLEESIAVIEIRKLECLTFVKSAFKQWQFAKTNEDKKMNQYRREQRLRKNVNLIAQLHTKKDYFNPEYQFQIVIDPQQPIIQQPTPPKISEEIKKSDEEERIFLILLVSFVIFQKSQTKALKKDSSESYIVEAGGAIPSWVSEAESVDNQGRPINSKLEQQPQQFENIINPVKQSQQQQEQIPPSNTQARRGIVKKEGKGHKNTQFQKNQEQPYKREIIQNEQEPIQDQKQPTIPQNQFSQQSQVQPKQQRERKNQVQQKESQPKKVYEEKVWDKPPQQQRQKSDESNNQIKYPEQRQQKQISPQPFQQEIQQEIKQTLTNDYQSKKNQIQQQQQQIKPASSASPENNDKKLNILKQIRKMQGISKLLIRKVPFMRMVRRTAQNICDENKLDTPRFTYESIVALQSLMEQTMIGIIEDANMITSNSNRVTLFGKDLNVLRKLRNAPWDYI